jgi:hypothetical protein
VRAAPFPSGVNNLKWKKSYFVAAVLAVSAVAYARPESSRDIIYYSDASMTTEAGGAGSIAAARRKPTGRSRRITSSRTSKAAIERQASFESHAI